MTTPPAAGGNSASSTRVGTNPLQRIEVIMSIGLFVAFFMPWVKIFFPGIWI